MIASSSDSMVSLSGSARDRRPAIWPWLVMPLVVLVVFFILYKIRQMSPQPTTGAESHVATVVDATSGR